MQTTTLYKSIEIPDKLFVSGTFNDIRNDVINILSSQDVFKDYDFAGSRLSVLVDAIAYGVLYMQQFSNAAEYESFIRTCLMRSSIVQHAQDYGYMPSSITGSTTQIRLTATHPSNPNSINIPKGTKFVGTVDRISPYDFVTWEDVSVLKGNDNKYITRLNLIQGQIIRQTYTNKLGFNLVIEDSSIDRRYIRLYVNGAEWVNWTNDSMIHVTGASSVYYMRETVEGFTEIYFGEGEISTDINSGLLTSHYVGGLKPSIGSKITIEYISTSGAVSNGSKNFQYVDSINNITVEEIAENPDNDPDYIGSDGGGDPENMERIRSLAPIMRETQRRCVTSSDYETFVSQTFGSIVQAVQCFTDNEKPGYAFISIKPMNGLTLTTVQKEDIQNYLSKFNLAPITPIVMSPDYLYIEHDIKVEYKTNELNKSEEWLQSQILKQIENYYTEKVEIFNKSFHVSKLLSYIDNADQSILGSDCTIRLVRERDNFYKSGMAGFSFNNGIEDGTLISSYINFYSEIEEPIVIIPETGNDDPEYIEPQTNFEILYTCTKKHSEDEALLLIGPFQEGEINNDHILPYDGDDFVHSPNETIKRNLYYEVGTVNYLTNSVYYDLGVLALDSKLFTATNIKFYVKPTDDNIYTGKGSLIVFEYDLRPEYINIEMEPIKDNE